MSTPNVTGETATRSIDEIVRHIGSPPDDGECEALTMDLQDAVDQLSEDPPPTPQRRRQLHARIRALAARARADGCKIFLR